MFNRQRNKEIDEFSRGLARELADQFDAARKKGGKASKSEKKIGVALNKVYSRAADFQQQHGLGVYGKARLGNAFKWELREIGYDDEFIDEATKGLLVNLNRK
ncbi:MAG: hypothetical protein R3174_12870 [Gammaproteobacteria bacterium]|nr:hypothetical protein [Gammaproteobacteria bacterium]